MTMRDDLPMSIVSPRGPASLCALMLGVFTLVPSLACAELALSAGAEYLRWVERTVPEVKETGLLYALGLAYTQDRDRGAVFAYRGKLWIGKVDYEGATLFGGTPVDSNTNYLGLNNELQARWRRPGRPDGTLDAVFGAGIDAWRRQLSSAQKEDYVIGYLRLGLESGTENPGRWSASLGLKYPVWTYENAHFNDIGFDSNPILHPGKELSPYGSLGYRFTPEVQIVAYYEGFRFDKSDRVQTNEVAMGLGPTTLEQPASKMSIFGLRLEYLLH